MPGAATDSAPNTGAVVTEAPLETRSPTIEDAPAIWRLVRDAPNLELNTAYAYLVLCHDFGETSLVAEADGELAGFIWGYNPPRRPEALFVWQIGVAAEQRGRGIGQHMLLTLLARRREHGVRFLEATVTDSNEPSQRLFRSIAREMDVGCEEEPHFTTEMFPESGHETETLLRIGPLRRRSGAPGLAAD